jgi:signal peptidase I
MALEPSRPPHNDTLAAWLIVPLTALLALILIVFYGMFDTTSVDGESMLPALRPADKVLLTKHYNGPVRGDVVVIRIIENEKPHEIVKRVVAVPGDRVEIRNDVAWVNGHQESTAAVILDPDTAVTVPAQRVPDGQIFVMGDNRPVSLDSRFIGLIPIPEVRGKVAAIFAPINRARVVN